MHKSFYQDKLVNSNFENLEKLIAKNKELEYEIITPENLKKCWICEKWVPYSICIDSLSFNIELEKAVFIHFEFDEFKPKLLNQFNSNSEFGNEVSLECMVPIGKWIIFFSQGIRGEKMTGMTSNQFEQ